MSGRAPNQKLQEDVRKHILQYCEDIKSLAKYTANSKTEVLSAIKNIGDLLEDKTIDIPVTEIKKQLTIIRGPVNVYDDKGSLIGIDAELMRLSSPAASNAPPTKPAAAPLKVPKEDTAALLRAQITALEAQIIELKENQQTLSTTNAAQKKQIQSQQDQLNAQQQDLQKLKADNNQLGQLTTKQDGEIKSLTTDKGVLQKELLAAQRQIKALKQDVDRLDSEKDKVLQEGEVLKKEHAELRSGKLTAEKELKTQGDEIARLSGLLAIAQEKIVLLDKNAATELEKLTAAKAQVDQLSGANKGLESKNGELEEKIQDLNEQLKNGDQANQQGLVKRDKMIEQLQQRLSAAEGREKLLTVENGGLKRKSIEDKEQVEFQKLELEKQRLENLSLQKQLKDQQAQHAQELAGKDDKIVGLEASLTELQKQQPDIAKLQKELEALTKENEELSSYKVGSTEGIKNLNAQIGVLEEEKSQFGQVIGALEDKNKTQEERIKELEKQSLEQQAQVEQQNAALTASQLENTDLKDGKSTLEEQNAGLLKQLNDMKIKMEAIEAESKSYMQIGMARLPEIKKLNTENSKLQSLLDQKTSDYSVVVEDFKEQLAGKDKLIQELQDKLMPLENSKSTQTDEPLVSPPNNVPTMELTQGKPPTPQDDKTTTTTGFLDTLGYSSPASSVGSYVHYGDEEQNIKAHYQVENITGSSKEISKLYEAGIMKFDGDDPSSPNKAQIHGEMSPAAKKGVVLLLEGVSKSNQDNEQNINVTISHFEDKDLLDILEQFHSNLNEKLKDPIGSDLQKIRCVEINYKGEDPKVKELIDEHNKVAKDTINVSTMSAEIKQAAHATLMEKIQSTKESLTVEQPNAPKSQQHKQTL